MRRDGLAALGWVVVPLGVSFELEQVEVIVTYFDGTLERRSCAIAQAEGGLYARASRKAITRALETALASFEG